MGGEPADYEADFVLWAEAQAAGLRRAAAAGSNLPLDWLNLAEEIEALGQSDRRELKSRCATIIEHLLKLQRSPADDPRQGWQATVRRERGNIQLLLDDSPSLRRELDRAVSVAWRLGAPTAYDELKSRGEAGGAPAPDPDQPGFTVDQVLGDWLPERADVPA